MRSKGEKIYKVHGSGRKEKFIMKKKMLSLLLAVVMVASVCACGNSKETQNQAESSETQKETSVTVVEEEKPLYPLVDEPITVKGVFIGTNPSDKMDRIVWNEVSELTGINIEWEVVPADALATCFSISFHLCMNAYSCVSAASAVSFSAEASCSSLSSSLCSILVRVTTLSPSLTFITRTPFEGLANMLMLLPKVQPTISRKRFRLP